MSEYREFTGKTVEEALRSATEDFGVGGLADLDFEILTQGSRGVLGMGAEQARIIAAPKTALGSAPPRREPAEVAPAAPAPVEPDPAPKAAADEPPPPPEAPVAPAEAPAELPAPAEPPAPAPESKSDRRRSSGRGSRSRGSSGTSTTEVPEGVVLEASSVKPEPDEEEVSEEALAAGQEILEQLVELMGYDARVEVTSGPTAKITVFGADDEQKEALGALIGRKGERLSALQHLVNLMLSRKMGTWTRVLVDVEDYRGRRERQLAEVAMRAAERVQETGQMLQLEPMSALERRWVHLSLRGVEGVATQSIGEEPERRVVVLKA
jgi:spoIIIJ-associated protein